MPTSLSNGSGNVNAAGGFTGNGSGMTGIQFSQLSGSLQDSQLNGEYGNQIILPNSMNMFTGSFTGTYVGNGSGLMGVLPAAGSPNYVQNNNSQPQTGASFNIDGFGTVGQTVLSYRDHHCYDISNSRPKLQRAEHWQQSQQ